MAEKNKINIANLVNSSGCFDLQFRKDTRYERPNSPTYYRWKLQFVITVPKEKIRILKRVKNAIYCGNIHITKDQARFSVQKLDDINNFIMPFFKKNKLAGKKKKDFELWQKAVQIIYSNKGKYIAKWKKNDLLSLIEIQKSTAKYKNQQKQPKWLEMAKLMTKKS